MALVIVVLVLAVAACGAGSTAQPASEDFVDYQESALVGLLNLDSSVERFNEEAVLYNELATACLRERGFEIPQLVAARVEADPMLAANQELGDEAFRLEHGFGVIDGVLANAGNSNPDVLNAYIGTLGRTEADSFRLAMFGDHSETDRSATCDGIARQQVDEQLGAQQWNLFGDFASEIDQRVNANSQVVSLHQEYATCMAKQGYDYQTPQEPALAASERFAMFMETVQMTDPKIFDLVESLTDTSRDDLERLRQQEIDEATDSLSCERSIRTELVTLSQQIEQDWIQENDDRIQELLDE